MRSRQRSAATGASVAWLAFSLLVIAVATLAPRSSESSTQNGFFQLGLLESSELWLDIIRNIALYLPYGAALSTRAATLSRAVLIAAATALSIELLQFAIPGRDPSFADVLYNLTGAVLGFAAAQTLGSKFDALLAKIERAILSVARPNERSAARLSLSAAAVCAVIVILTSWLSLPDYSIGGKYMVTGPIMDASAGNLRIGNNESGTRALRGLLDEVRVYSRAISPMEVLSDMHRAVDSSDRSLKGLLFSFGFSSDDSLAMDASGNERNGTRIGVRWVDRGRFGGAMEFPGSGGVITLPDARSLDLTTGMTLAAWVFPADTIPFTGAIISHDGDSYYLRASTFGRPFIPSAGANFGEASRMIWFERPIGWKVWTHLAATYDGEVFRLFVNGILVSSSIIWSAHRPLGSDLNGEVMRMGELPNTVGIRRTLMSDFTLQVRIACGERRTHSGPIFAIATEGDADPMSLWVLGSDIWVRYAALSQKLSLEAPSYHARRALQGCETGQSREITIRGPLQRVRMEVDGAQVRGTPVSFMSVWQLLVPSEPLAAAARLFCTGAWGFLLFGPFGFWARRSIPTLLGLLLIVASVGTAQQVFQTPLPDLLQLAAAASGCSLGFVARRAIGPPARVPSR